MTSKPQIAPTKSKPFTIRETPKAHEKVHKSVYEPVQTRNSPKKSSPKKSSTHQYENEEPYSKAKKFSRDEEIEQFSNTQNFDRHREGIDSVANQNIRKSMNNLQMNENSMKMIEERSKYNDSKTSTRIQSVTQTKPPLNNSSSQSSFGQMPGIMDLGSKKKIGQVPTSMTTNEERRHETLKIEQSKKPLFGKTSNTVCEKHDTMESFQESSMKPTLTANTIVKDRSQTSSEEPESSEEEEEKRPPSTNAIKVEKQESSSENESEPERDQEEQDNESDEEEFPVALNRLVFSFLPQEIADKLNDTHDWKKRTYAIQETENLIKKQFVRPNEDFSLYIPDICKKM